jgi:hypothetical protein
MNNIDNEKYSLDYKPSFVKRLKSISNKRFWMRQITIYRIIAAVGLIIAAALALVIPAHMTEPDDWAYYYAIHNFAEGKLVVSDELHITQVKEALSQGGQLIQYVNIGTGKWALEKAPGYVVYEIPFELLGIPRWGNVLLTLGVVLVTFLFLQRLLDEKAACIGSLLMLFTPVSLIMLNRSYMDSFAAGAFLVMGGAMYLYWVLEKGNFGRRKSFLLLFLAFLLIAWSVVTRYTNVVVAVIFAIHFAFLEIKALHKRVKTDFLFEIPAMLFGIGIPLAFLLFYDKAVFGSPLNYGYRYTQGDITFAFQHIGAITQSGQSVFWNIIKTNIQNAPRNLLLGFPLLIIAIPGFFIALWGAFRRNRERWSNLSPDLRWDILLLILGWFAGVFLLYITYEWTAQIGNRPFIVFARFYLPGLFPLVVVSALLLSKFRATLSLAIIAVILAVSSFLYFQSLNSEPGHPAGGPPNRPPNGPYQPPNGNRPPGLPPGLRSGSGPTTRSLPTSTTPDQVPP